GEDLGDARRELGGVVAHGDDGVGPAFLGVRHHADASFGAGLLADFFVGGDVAAEDAGEGAANPLTNGRRPHDDAANDAKVLGDLVPFQTVGGGHDYGGVDHGYPLYLSLLSPKAAGVGDTHGFSAISPRSCFRPRRKSGSRWRRASKRR